ncbi:MAG: Rpn family recombination-promoting nuclease/putative transposase [Verrucomicrobiota bacterium]|nr:Rpn family recombination-promoting nuclease/putative transposase [Verrucomicrobiota bacterium]
MIHQPHDKLFKSSFQDIPTAIEFFKNYLPATVVDALDWSTLRLLPGRHLNDKLKSSESDLLYEISNFAGEQSLLYVLFEHQRLEDRWIAFRLVSYMIEIWQNFRKQSPSALKLPVIIPIVLAQNHQHWTTSPHFSDLLNLTGLPDAFKSHTLNLTFSLLELSRQAYAELVGTPLGVMTLRVMKAEQTEDWRNPVILDEKLLIQLNASDLERILRYVFQVSNLDTETAENIIENIQSETIRNTTMTLAEKFILKGQQEGWQKGQHEGWQKGQHEGWQKGRHEGWQKGQHEGWQKGQHEGLVDGLIRQIHAFEKVLGNNSTDTETLKALTVTELEQRAAQLQTALSQRLQG